MFLHLLWRAFTRSPITDGGFTFLRPTVEIIATNFAKMLPRTTPSNIYCVLKGSANLIHELAFLFAMYRPNSLRVKHSLEGEVWVNIHVTLWGDDVAHARHS